MFERLAKLNELPDRLKVPHLNLVVGFLGKALSRQARIDVITEHRNLLEVVERGIRSNNDFKTSMLMMAMFLKDWHDDSTSETAEADNAVFEKYISPLLEFVLNNFRDTEQEYEFLQSCLPLRVSLPHLADRLDILVEHYGKLASHVYQNSNRRNLNSSMINLSTRSL